MDLSTLVRRSVASKASFGGPLSFDALLSSESGLASGLVLCLSIYCCCFCGVISDEGCLLMLPLLSNASLLIALLDANNGSDDLALLFVA
jgi:hypothetical protein